MTVTRLLAASVENRCNSGTQSSYFGLDTRQTVTAVVEGGAATISAAL